MLEFRGRKQPNLLATIDHIIPTGLGGSDEPDNLRLICFQCNHKKDTLMPAEHKSKELAEQLATAINAAAHVEDMTIDPFHVTLSCKMCEAMGLDANAAVVDNDET